jgi:DNA-binding XRE family transcriptional regulator
VWYDGKKEKGVYSRLKKEEFSRIRRYLGKTQSQLAQLLGVSYKAIQSFEQGWRNIPVHTERQVLLLVALKKASPKKDRPCWVVRKCPMETKRNCPAWELQAGYLCWFINGTICQGQVQSSWRKKMELCRQCNVFQTMLPPLQ